jgi:formylglycine-generating enzyme required for sulfatase activity
MTIDTRMILVPASSFLMGSEAGYQEERPVHEVSVSAFLMDVHPVTNAEYRRYCDACSLTYPPDPPWRESPDYFIEYPEHPVVNVSWQQAADFASWSGKRLPTEAEWEVAARGGPRTAPYPWGEAPPDGNLTNFADRESDYAWRDFRTSSGFSFTSPVGSFPANALGLSDMAGNVWEWCDGWYFPYDDTVRDLARLEDGWGGYRVCRGGCYHSSAFDLRVTRRRQVLGGQGQMSVGFRCVQDPDGIRHPSLVVVDTGNEPAQSGSDLQTHSDRNTPPLPQISDPTPFEICVGTGPLTLDQALRIKDAGFTSVEQYVTWRTVESEGEDLWNFHAWDEQVEVLKKAGLKWVPFLIAGPAYSLPDWFREGSGHLPLRCLEHNLDSAVQSLWDRPFLTHVERFLSAFAKRYRDKHILESVLLGISGDFGEAIYPVWHGNWPTQTAGLYHSHSGYWCNDREARKDFRIRMEMLYGTVEELDAAWGTGFHDFQAVRAPIVQSDPIEGFRVDEHTPAGRYLPESPCERRRWVDFVDWYRGSMSRYAEEWLEIARRHFPDHRVDLCTGGDAVSNHGSDFASQCRAAARHGGGVRITNESSDYAQNFFLTHWVASASRFHGSAFSFEPAGKVTIDGIVRRIFNAASTGAQGLHFYEANILQSRDRLTTFQRNLHHLHPGKVDARIGAIYPDVSVLVGDVAPFELQKHFEILRDCLDFAYLDDQSIEDGMLDTMDAAILCCGRFHRKSTLDTLGGWLVRGGRLFVYNIDSLHPLDSDDDVLSDFLNPAGGEKKVGKGASFYLKQRVRVTLENPNAIPGTQVAHARMDRTEDELQKEVFGPLVDFLRAHEVWVPDGILDGIYISTLEDRILCLETTGKAQEKNLFQAGGQRMRIHLEPGCILEIPR